MFGDGKELSLDLCQHCVKEILGEWIKVVDPGLGSREEFDERKASNEFVGTHGLPLSPEAFEASRVALDAPPVPNERLVRLMRSCFPAWEQKNGVSVSREDSETAHLLRSPANAEHLERSITALAGAVRLPVTWRDGPPTLRARRLAQVLRLVWQSDKDAAAWLTTEHPELGARTPLEAARSESGARRVEQILLRIFFGIPG
ncbi:antitoxin Xre/MbcA/ParS toxin-binding domain-containing protein [Paraburkholderia youngii]|uniref:antitoxin Xre/MbcA/ParS toxin-binding domain-containing protein n=1 Tax=Paraburkholderia youngii TaxID=2782701 RepID=UPI003D224B94